MQHCNSCEWPDTLLTRCFYCQFFQLMHLVCYFLLFLKDKFYFFGDAKPILDQLIKIIISIYQVTIDKHEKRLLKT